VLTEPLFDRLTEIDRAIRVAPHFLLCVDFDGTLAPIVPDPADARIPDDTRAVLEALASRPDTTIAVVSGRAIRDLRTKVHLDNAVLAGNHGLEIEGGGIQLHYAVALKWLSALHEMCRDLTLRVSDIPGALVEDKGLSATVHYRKVAQKDQLKVAGMVQEVVAPHLNHFSLRRGKEIFEILPRVAWNKGSAVRLIIRRLQQHAERKLSVCYIGDDLTDEFAFHELAGDITIRVGNDMPTCARFSVRDPWDVYVFLRWILAGHDPTMALGAGCG
jgi:trehalose 6-phosphate phosphatase